MTLSEHYKTLQLRYILKYLEILYAKCPTSSLGRFSVALEGKGKIKRPGNEVAKRQGNLQNTTVKY